MATTIIITLYILLLLAYVFDISSSKTKIPTVVLLLLLGVVVKKITTYINIAIPDLSPILPFLGTIGLILIVLEGSLELELNRLKGPLIAKSSFIALIPMLVLSFGLAYAFHAIGHVPFKIGLANAIPFAVISSAIAIPSARNLIKSNKEFVTYESSLSDIFGVLFFNFITLNDEIGGNSFGNFFLEILVMLLVTFVSTLVLAFLLSKIKHHVKFVPIILMVLLIYSISKLYHLPALIFILLFGLFLGNLDELKNIKFIQRLQPEFLNKEVHKFKKLTMEIAFLIRSLFFLLFGYLIKIEELFNMETLIWAVYIVIAIFIIRFCFLKIVKLPVNPLIYLAPRGLITILLFLSIPQTQAIPLANNSLVIQVIILCALFMMIGLLTQKHKEEINSEEEVDIDDDYFN